MDKTEYILRSLSGGELQRLACELLPRMNHEWGDLIHNGIVEGTTKTRKGTPDMWKESKEGVLIYIQVTTDSKPGKILKDIHASVSKLKEQGRMGNALCIAFVNMEPDAKEIQICSSLCNDNKFDFELINNSKITRALDQSHNHDLREKFLGIRSDYHIHISTIMTRKKDLYIPLIEDVIKLIEKCKRSDLFSKLNDTFIQEVIQKQYKYRLDEQILVFLKEIDNKIKLFNQIDAIYVAKNLILNLFHKGFKELYGDIIDGEIPIYFEGELVDYEDVYPEEYDNIRRISSNDDLVKKAICGEYEYVEFNGELYNPTLVKMFEFALAERNKFHSVQRVPIVAWKGPPEFYIASIGNFYSMYSDDEDIKNKKNILKEIISRAENMENTLDQILKEIFEKFEKI